MVRTHARSPSPSRDTDESPTLKRIKSSHNSISPLTESQVSADPTPYFANELLSPHNIHRLNQEYAASQPFKYCKVEKLFQDDLLKGVKDECLSELRFTQKETDIYKVNQTGDLASLSYLTESQLGLLPNLLILRDALYSPKFRSFLQAVTGCGPLSGSKQDMSVNTYTKGCHLLNHDDVIGTRRVSYILYMPLPNYQGWQPEWGGALELYPVQIGPDGVPEPETIPSKCVPPSWNQFIFFEVQPGKSFHSVEEVVVGEGEDGRQRLSISGWFHAAQPGEEGYDANEKWGEYKSSREQLASTSTDFKPYPEDEDTPLPSAPLSASHISFLSEFLNPVYLQPRIMSSLSKRFVEESSLELHSFLSEPLATKLAHGLAANDIRDDLGPNRTRRIPAHTAGTSVSVSVSPSSSSSSSAIPSVEIPWDLKGPPHKRRYCTLAPIPSGGKHESVVPRSAHTSPDAIVRCLQNELFPSPAFRAWLAIVSSVVPLRWDVEARRFRPGLDYTLATSEENEARLDVVLGLTPEVGGGVGGEKGEGVRETEKRKGKRQGEEKVVGGWQSGEWGGWECYMAPHEEEDDPAVYRSGSSGKKQKSEASPTPAPAPPLQASSKGDGKGAQTNGNGSASGTNGTHKRSDSQGSAKAAVETDGSEVSDEEDEDGTLLAVQPGFNRLLLVLRDEKVMRFVKYVSAAAEGSRWDVCAEYEIGMIEENEDEEGATKAL
ncbi:Oxoglutarate and iron-dependent oxygenase degradation C-term-domain-containing protein [Cytidiella melzeri]|nr:Oxoglutarate and iron-dependent oxygenase degradation C-term-domain-containing protein [Cytidiella melzeri]